MKPKETVRERKFSDASARRFTRGAAGIFNLRNSSASEKVISTELNDATVKFHRIADAITHTVIAETIIYGRRKKRFVEGKGLIFA